jgi:hypothetical protein
MEKITKEYIEKLFDRYNEEYFRGELTCKKFGTFFTHIESGDHILGKCFCEGKKSKIWISSNALWDEESLKDVMLHEMIHLYNAEILGKADTFPFFHGRRFRKKKREIEKEYGIKVKKVSEVYIKKEKVPSTWIGKSMRHIKLVTGIF